MSDDLLITECLEILWNTVYLSRAARLVSTSPSTAITFFPLQNDFGPGGIRAQLSSMPLSVRFRTDSATDA
jgi:hypothetical protein